MKRILLILVALLCFTVTFSQISSRMNYKKIAAKKNANYFEIVKAKRAEIANYDMSKLANKKEYKHFERWAYFWKDRIDANGNFPSENLGYFNAGILDTKGRLINKNISNKTNVTTWTNIGPSSLPVANGYPNFPQMGRLNSFFRFKHATVAAQNVLFVGSPNGGLWKSVDNGVNWSPKLDQVSGIGVTDVRANPSATFSSSTVMYASTGDYDGQNANSIGVLKSTDGGDTWNSTGLSFTVNQTEVTSNLIVLDDNTVIVGTKLKIKKTTDGGATWVDKKTSTTSADFGRFVISNNKIMCADIKGGIYLSTDTGDTWTEVLAPGSNENKTALTAEGDIFYANNKAGEFKKYDTALGSPSWVTVGISVPNYDSQQGFNQALSVKGGLIISGSINGLTSRDNGATWTKTLNGYWSSNSDPGTYIHSDWHNVGHLNGDGTFDYWSVNDGGLNFFTFTDINDVTPSVTYKSEGVVNTQLYSAAIVPGTAGHYLMGNQDNDGFSREMHGGSMQWIAAEAGDGTCTAINYNDPNIRFLGSTQGAISMTTVGFSNNYQGNTTLNNVPGAAFIWPLEMNTTDPTKLYAGGDDVYLLNTTANSAHTALNAGTGEVSFISTHGNNIMAVGLNAIKKSIDGGTTWNAINEASSDLNIYINSLDFKNTDPNIVYATTDGYLATDKVFKSTDGGANWTNITGTLPNIVMKKILLKQNEATEILFVATELGVYFKNNNSAWTKLGDSELPNVDVRDIDINYTSDKLVAATFGRGLWEATIANATLGVEDQNIVNINTAIFPNPIKGGFLNVNLKSYNTNSNSYKYSIFNVLGGIVKTGNLEKQNNQLNVSNLASGIYLLKVAHGNESVVKKIIKE